MSPDQTRNQPPTKSNSKRINFWPSAPREHLCIHAPPLPSQQRRSRVCKDLESCRAGCLSMVVLRQDYWSTRSWCRLGLPSLHDKSSRRWNERILRWSPLGAQRERWSLRDWLRRLISIMSYAVLLEWLHESRANWPSRLNKYIV